MYVIKRKRIKPEAIYKKGIDIIIINSAIKEKKEEESKFFKKKGCALC